MGGDSWCVTPGATRSWLFAVLALLALFSGFGVGVVTGPLPAFDRGRAAWDTLIHGPPPIRVLPPLAGVVPVPSTIASEQPRSPSLGSGQATVRAPAQSAPSARLTVSGSAARVILAFPVPPAPTIEPQPSADPTTTSADTAPADTADPADTAAESPPTDTDTATPAPSTPTRSAPDPRKGAVNGAAPETEDPTSASVTPSAQTPPSTAPAAVTASPTTTNGPDSEPTTGGRHGRRATEHPSDGPDAG